MDYFPSQQDFIQKIMMIKNITVNLYNGYFSMLTDLSLMTTFVRQPLSLFPLTTLFSILTDLMGQPRV